MEPAMQNTRFPSTVLALASLATAVSLSACGRIDDDRTVARKIDSGELTAKAGTRADSAAESTKTMGAAAADKVDDATLTARVNASLAKDKDLSALRIDVDTQNGVVTLSGPAPTATAKERASEIARSVKGVNSVNNQLTIRSS
jgi:hyperosmotically inducible periplasmic protein